jgi:hypothetical protein
MFYPEYSTASYKYIFKWLKPSFKNIFWPSSLENWVRSYPLQNNLAAPMCSKFVGKKRLETKYVPLIVFLYVSIILKSVVFMDMVTCVVVEFIKFQRNTHYPSTKLYDVTSLKTGLNIQEVYLVGYNTSA